MPLPNFNYRYRKRHQTLSLSASVFFRVFFHLCCCCSRVKKSLVLFLQSGGLSFSLPTEINMGDHPKRHGKLFALRNGLYNYTTPPLILLKSYRARVPPSAVLLAFINTEITLREI